MKKFLVGLCLMMASGIFASQRACTVRGKQNIQQQQRAEFNRQQRQRRVGAGSSTVTLQGEVLHCRGLSVRDQQRLRAIEDSRERYSVSFKSIICLLRERYNQDLTIDEYTVVHDDLRVKGWRLTAGTKVEQDLLLNAILKFKGIQTGHQHAVAIVQS